MNRRPRLALDFETYLMNEHSVMPKPVCLVMTYESPDEPGVVADECLIVGMQDMHDALEYALLQQEYVLVFHSGAYDLCVAHEWFPDLREAIYEALFSDVAAPQDTLIREKLLNLAQHGKLQFLSAASDDKGWIDEDDAPAGRMIDYKLSTLVNDYFGEDISESKDDEYSWRMNYDVLDDMPLEDWPQDAIDYALDDGRWTLRIAAAQDYREEHNDAPAAFTTQDFQTRSQFCLTLMGNQGLLVDPKRRAEVIKEIESELTPEKISLLIEGGIVIPAKAAEPRFTAKGKRMISKATGEQLWKKAQPEKSRHTKLHAHIKRVCAAHRIVCEMTDGGKSGKKNPSMKKSWLMRLVAQTQDPTLEQWLFRQSFQKLLTTYLPQQLRIDENGKKTGEVAERVFANFNVLVETGRTSSYAGSLYPSMNGQNQDPRVRPIFVANEGGGEGEWCFVSVDYSALELVSLAQRCYDLFGYSVLRDNINAGVDSHGYLGAQLCAAMENSDASAALLQQNSDMERYELFASWKTSKNAALAKVYAHYRKFAKPTGLGFPGGLGAATFVEFAFGTYDVKTTEEEARVLKRLWLDTYPEMVQYFRHVNLNMQDPRFPDRYVYRTRGGLVRSNASYCATCNGAGMQSPSAEGAKRAVNRVVRKSWDKTQGSILYGNCIPLLFIHDEIFAKVRVEYLHECAKVIVDTMVAAMSETMPDMVVRAEPAAMWRWDKGAEPVYDKDTGRLLVWVPKETKEVA